MPSISSATFTPMQWNACPKNIPGSLPFAGGMKFTRYAWNGTQTASEDVIARLKSARSNSKTETSILARLAAQKAYGQLQPSASSIEGGDAATDALAWANNRKAELKARLDNALASGAEVKNISEKKIPLRRRGQRRPVHPRLPRRETSDKRLLRRRSIKICLIPQDRVY